MVRVRPAAGNDRSRRVRELRSALDVPARLQLLYRRLCLLHRVYITNLNTYVFGSDLSMFGVVLVCTVVHARLFGPFGLR